MTKLPPTRLDICNELAKSISIWSGHVLKKAESMIPKIVDNILHSAGTRLGTIARISEPLDDICNGKSTFEEGASIMLDIPRKYTYTKEPREDVLWKLLSGEESTETSLKIPFGQFWLRKLIENISGSNLTLEKFLETIPSIDILGRSVPDVSLPSHNQIRDAFASSYVKSEFRKLRENLAYESGGFEGIFRKLAVSRRFFRTERNHLGLCHSSTRPGDEVWCLVRAPTPFIFRKTGDAKNFKLVGPAYIYGFVDSILPTLEVENSDIRIE